MNRILPLVLGLALQAGSALAHASLDSAVPADGATVAAPEAVVLTFSEAVSGTLSGARLTAADGSAVAVGAASMSADRTTLTLAMAGVLPAGVYTVAWHAQSRDGHKTHGTLTFTVQ